MCIHTFFHRCSGSYLKKIPTVGEGSTILTTSEHIILTSGNLSIFIIFHNTVFVNCFKLLKLFNYVIVQHKQCLLFCITWVGLKILPRHQKSALVYLQCISEFHPRWHSLYLQLQPFLEQFVPPSLFASCHQ